MLDSRSQSLLPTILDHRIGSHGLIPNINCLSCPCTFACTQERSFFSLTPAFPPFRKNFRTLFQNDCCFVAWLITDAHTASKTTLVILEAAGPLSCITHSPLQSAGLRVLDRHTGVCQKNTVAFAPRSGSRKWYPCPDLALSKLVQSSKVSSYREDTFLQTPEFIPIPIPKKKTLHTSYTRSFYRCFLQIALRARAGA